MAEIGDLSRFEHPRKLMGYLGLVPSEHSSGERVCRVASARVSRRAQLRQEDLNEQVRALGWKAQLRLTKRFAALKNRGVQINTVCVAVARELTGIIWAIGRSNDDRRPRDEDGNPKGGRYKREFGVPEAKAEDNFTDPDSRIMKRAGGCFDASYNAQTAMDDTARIIVAAELSNNAADTHQMVPMLQAVKTNTGEFPRHGLADAGYRSEDNFERLTGLPIELVVALGREGKQHAQIDPNIHPHTVAMATKLQTE